MKNKMFASLAALALVFTAPAMAQKSSGERVDDGTIVTEVKANLVGREGRAPRPTSTSRSTRASRAERLRQDPSREGRGGRGCQESEARRVRAQRDRDPPGHVDGHQAR